MRLSRQAPAHGDLDARAVTTAVNNVRNNGPQLLDDAPEPDTGV
ncbi:hypothetical protein ACFY41_29275 [Streptomyces syringium]